MTRSANSLAYPVGTRIVNAHWGRHPFIDGKGRHYWIVGERCYPNSEDSGHCYLTNESGQTEKIDPSIFTPEPVGIWKIIYPKENLFDQLYIKMTT